MQRIIIDYEAELGSVFMLLEPLPDAAVFDVTRDVCRRRRSVNGLLPTLRQVHHLSGCLLI